MKKALINQIIKSIVENNNQSNFARHCTWCNAGKRAAK